MELQWHLHPKQLNARVATSAAYQYRIILWKDGKAELSVQHRGDAPSAKPIKRFAYRNHIGAIGGAQRFEDKHGYRDPAHSAPAEIVPFLPELPERITREIDAVQQDAKAAARMVEADTAPHAFADEAYAEYLTLCASVLCCEDYDCYNRTEIGAHWCATHQAERDLMTEDEV